MHKLSITALAGVLALTTSGSERDKTIQPSPTAFSPKKPDLISPQEPAILEQNSQKPNLYPPGLIQSTNVDQRLKDIQLGRLDPFTGVFPHFEVAQEPQKAFPEKLKLPTVKKLPVPTKPTPPSTDDAKGVAVEGVVQAGDESHAIIKLPQDSTSRYVSEGQQLPGGELLVKRIEFPEDSDPVVVLEQNGVEIAKAVGEPASEQTEESTKIASSMGASSDSEPSDSLADDSSPSDSEISDSETGDSEAVEPVKVTQQEEHIAAIPVPSPPPKSSSTKKSVHVAAPPAPTNYKPPVDIASVVKAHPSETVLSSSEEDSVRSLNASSDRAGQDQLVVSPYTSSPDLPENQPQFTASANTLNPTDRQQLIERLRQSSTSPIGNNIESSSIPTLQANVEGTSKQQLINQLRSENPLSTSDELSTQKDSRILLHKQKLINQLRAAKSMSNYE